MEGNDKFYILDKKFFDRNELLETIVHNYLDNDKYGGVSLTSLMNSKTKSTDMFGIIYRVQGQDNQIFLESSDFQLLLSRVKQMLNDGDVQILPPEAYNFHNRIGFPSVDKQLECLDGESSPDCAIYPSKNILKDFVDKANYEENPYGYQLALCEPKYSFINFDPNILEFYRNDPRYNYEDSGIEGKISAKSEFRGDVGEFNLEHFTYAIGENRRRVVAVFLTDLVGQPKDDQVRWSLSQIDGVFQPHPDFCQRYLDGQWGNSISILSAILYEVYITNKYCEQIGRASLFTTAIETGLGNAPKEFSFIIRPTQKTYFEFIVSLEKLVCNMNVKFFKEDNIKTFEDRYDENRKLDKKPIGTITLLNNWFSELFLDCDKEEISAVVKVLRDVRKERQTPAHEVVTDSYDESFNIRQIELLMRVYIALKTIRIAVGCIPGTNGDEIREIDIVSNSKIYPM